MNAGALQPNTSKLEKIKVNESDQRYEDTVTSIVADLAINKENPQINDAKV